MYVDKILTVIEEAKKYNYPEMCLRNDLRQVINEITSEFEGYNYTDRDVDCIKEEYGDERYEEGVEDGRVEGQLDLLNFFTQAEVLENLCKITVEDDFIEYLEDLEKQIKKTGCLY